MISALISRNALALAAIAGLIVWGQVALKNHDRKVEERAVAKIEKKTDALVQKAKVAQRRVDPAKSGGVLDKRYCEDC